MMAECSYLGTARRKSPSLLASPISCPSASHHFKTMGRLIRFAESRRQTDMNERPKLGSGQSGLNGRLWVSAAAKP